MLSLWPMPDTWRASAAWRVERWGKPWYAQNQTVQSLTQFSLYILNVGIFQAKVSSSQCYVDFPSVDLSWVLCLFGPPGIQSIAKARSTTNDLNLANQSVVHGPAAGASIWKFV